MVALIGATFVDAGHGHRCLQLVQFLGQHAVQLLPAHQTVLCQHHAAVGLRIEILTQLRRQQVRKPRGLVRALLTDEHKHDVIYNRRIDPRCHHRHQPLLQVLVEQQLFVSIPSDIHRHSQQQDVVTVLLLPVWQVLQIVAERVIARYEVRLDDVLQVLLDDGLLLTQFPP